MKKSIFILCIGMFALSISFTSCYYDNEEDLYPGGTACDTANVTYSANVVPLFAAQCNACHSGGAPAANIATDNYTSVKANISRIKGAINHTSGFSPMPQGGNKFTDCELKKIDAWINKGMPNN